MAASLNKAMIIGNLTRDPELRQTNSGQPVCSFGVATNRTWNNRQTGEKQESTEFHNIVAWGRLAEIINQYLKKGNKIFVEGRLQTRDWEGQDGVKRYRTEIVAENMVMLGGRSGGSGQFGGSDSSSSAPMGTDEPPTINADDDIKLEDIPF